MSVSLPTEVLSEQLTGAIGGRHVRAGVFTSFNFDPGFFELQVLPMLFDQSFSQVDKVRLLQLEDALRTIDHLAVYYDRGALAQDAEPARLDYRRIDVRRKTGVFHPKLVMLLVDDPQEEEGEVTQSLVLAVQSANLTRAGWWENVECAHIEEIRDKDLDRTRYPFRSDLLAILRRIERCAEEGADHSALEVVRRFLRERVNTDEMRQASSQGRYFTRLFGGLGGAGLPAWLRELRLHRNEWNLEVISPYFDPSGAGPLIGLKEAVNAVEVRVYLPRDMDGKALVTEKTYQAVAEHAGWGEMPPEFLSRGRGGAGERLAPRRVHAKVYRLWRMDGADLVIVGSVNLTGSGHSHGGAGNLEAAFLVDVSEQRWPRRWWLERIEHDANRFLDESPAEDDGMEAVPVDVSVRYDWASGVLAYRLGDSVDGELDVHDIAGLKLLTIDARVTDKWVDCGAEATERVRERLRSSSFLVVHYGNTRWRVLVREENMEHRPSLLADLTAEEILEYWSLLSAEQRAAFLEEHAAAGLELEGLPVAERHKLEARNTLFDRFAGLYHALGCLERSVIAAIEENRKREAVARLFGAKYDSLPAFLNKTLERADGDPVFRYVTFLSASQLVERLRHKQATFFEKHQVHVGALDTVLARLPEVRAALPFDEVPDLGDFVNWYEPAFLRHLGA